MLWAKAFNMLHPPERPYCVELKHILESVLLQRPEFP